LAKGFCGTSMPVNSAVQVVIDSVLIVTMVFECLTPALAQVRFFTGSHAGAWEPVITLNRNKCPLLSLGDHFTCM
jgi:hypothetical protein